MAAPTYVSASGSHNGLTNQISTFSWAVPATLAGDVILLFAGVNINDANAFTTPSGYTPVGTAVLTGSNHVSRVFGRKTTSNESAATVTTAVSTGGRLHGGLIVVRGAEGIPTNFATNTDTSAGSTIQIPGLTTDSVDNLIVGAVMARHTETTQQSVTGISGASSGWTERADSGTDNAATPNFVFCVATRNTIIATSGGSFTGPTFTLSTATATGHGYSFAFEPAVVNVSPTVVLAASKTEDVEPGETITLTATAADPDGTITGVTFAQTAGSPTVAITDLGSTATFVFPPTMDGTTLTFTSTATDNSGASTTSAPLTVQGFPASMRVVVGGVLTPTLLRLPGSLIAVTQGLGYIGDGATYQDNSGAPRASLVANGWPDSQVEVDGLPDRTLALAGVTHPNVGEVIDAWRANGFDPYTWVLALGLHNLGSSDADWTSMIGQILDKIAEGPRVGYKVNFVGISLRDSADTRPTRFISVLNALIGTRAKITLVPIPWNAYVHNGRDETGLWIGSADDAVGRFMTTAGYALRNSYITTQVGAPA